MINKPVVMTCSLLILALILSGCGGSKTASGAISSRTPSTSAVSPIPKTSSATSKTTSQTAEALADILGHNASISSVKYDQVITSKNTTVTQTVWIKKTKMRMEMSQQGQAFVVLLDTETRTMYNYLPAQKIAYKVSYQKSDSALDSAASIMDYNPRVVGVETVDGKLCAVVEYAPGGGTTVKTWIWKENGFPVRMETTSNSGKSVIEYRNVDFSNISDSMFQLPAGITVMTMPG